MEFGEGGDGRKPGLDRLGPELWEGYFEAVRRIGAELGGAAPLDELLPRTLERLRLAAWAEQCALYRTEPRGEHLFARLRHRASRAEESGPAEGFLMDGS
ncbi:MAG: hypothetical protein D6739_12175, partial [Nitrospirae bacterium]